MQHSRKNRGQDMPDDQMDFRIRQLRYVFENMEDALCVTNKQGVLLQINPSARKLLNIPDGAGREEKKLWEYIPYIEENDALIQLFIDAVAAGKKIRQSLVGYRNAEGNDFRLRVSLSYTLEEGGMFVILMNDLTDLFRVNTAFARYTSPEIADYVLRSPEGERSGGESREVTILMSDLRDFTGISDGLKPDQLVVLLNHYFEKMVEIIERRKGTVIEFLGDGIFVVFGAPKEDPDHAVNAVKCAVEMQNEMCGINEWNRQNGFPELRMGIGINSGEAVVGNIGSSLKMKYGCMGDAVNVAGRAESFTVGGQIYITQDTCSAIREELLIRGTYTFQAKGKKDPLTIYEVIGIGDDLKLSEQAETGWMIPGEEGIPVMVHLLREKTVTGTGIAGNLKSVTSDCSRAILHTSEKLETMQDILLDICGGMSAKITETDGEDCTICFTSGTDKFEKMVRSRTYLS